MSTTSGWNKGDQWDYIVMWKNLMLYCERNKKTRPGVKGKSWEKSPEGKWRVSELE